MSYYRSLGRNDYTVHVTSIMWLLLYIIQKFICHFYIYCAIIRQIDKMNTLKPSLVCPYYLGKCENTGFHLFGSCYSNKYWEILNFNNDVWVKYNLYSFRISTDGRFFFTFHLLNSHLVSLSTHIFYGRTIIIIDKILTRLKFLTIKLVALYHNQSKENSDTISNLFWNTINIVRRKILLKRPSFAI